MRHRRLRRHFWMEIIHTKINATLIEEIYADATSEPSDTTLMESDDVIDETDIFSLLHTSPHLPTQQQSQSPTSHSLTSKVVNPTT